MQVSIQAIGRASVISSKELPMGIWTGLLRALHDSRRLLAARMIFQYRHLVQDYPRVDYPDCANEAGKKTRRTELAEQ